MNTSKPLVVLIDNTKLSTCCRAIRTCWDSFSRGGKYEIPTDDITQTDIELMERSIKKDKHSSTSEHLIYQFYIGNVSRALLQELARHRIASLSVRSTRYTLKQLNNIPCIPREDLDKYCILTGNEIVDENSYRALINLQAAIKKGIPNDRAKFCLPDSFKTELIYSINARSLQNLLTLRTNPSAMWEIRLLAYELYNKLPENHKFLFEVYLEEKENA